MKKEIEPPVEEMGAPAGDNYPVNDGIRAGEEYVNDVNDQLCRGNLKDNSSGDGSEYGCEGYASPIDRESYSQPSDKYDSQVSREEGSLPMQVRVDHPWAGSIAPFHIQHTLGQSRSQSLHKERNPSPQTAFPKLQIYDRIADDLIAIRVHPKVSHSELIDKVVQSGLRSEIRVLKYRDCTTNTFVSLDTDEELQAWMQRTEKHVLYAE
ncbi:hypothetical protein EST38_g74 [Candolleomyces aberdarensis]|uniref:PB1 domain-containing protein n=1 Tax=Candolleomyces aberdarensis TaxID=2316362 RepID=A0A4Q2E2X4_9AGAR|nr:hypothetical protein EST38_g74 [Candolleomyces aberdarensis]